MVDKQKHVDFDFNEIDRGFSLKTITIQTSKSYISYLIAIEWDICFGSCYIYKKYIINGTNM